VSTLSIRIAKLIPRIGSGSPSTTPPRAHERELVRRPLDVTPHVASTTAAALNAEQAAHRFKDALLSVRTEPLRNTQAVHASSAPQVYDTPQKLGTSLASKGGSGGLFSISFTLPPLNIVASTNTAASPPWSLGRRATPPKHHAKSVPLKSTPTSTVGVAAFDWGPLLAIKPMTTLWSGSRIVDLMYYKLKYLTSTVVRTSRFSPTFVSPSRVITSRSSLCRLFILRHNSPFRHKNSTCYGLQTCWMNSGS
jgi:hypothetical protein